MDDQDRIVVKSSELPKTVVLELGNGVKKKYSLLFTKKAEGLILNKSV